MKKLLKSIMRSLAGTGFVYRLSRKMTDYHDGLNNSDFKTNGEAGFLKRNASGFKMIFDVGANVGDWSLFVNRLNPAAAIYAFEPVAETFAILKERGFNDKVKVGNIALGEREGTVDFHVYGDSTLNSVVARDGGAVAGTAKIEAVRMDTLDHFTAANDIGPVDFLKIDTEGQELAVLKGAARLLGEKKIRIIQFEYGGTYIDAGILLKDVFKFLSDRQYLIYKIHPEGIEEIKKYGHALENFQYANYLAALPGVEIK